MEDPTAILKDLHRLLALMAESHRLQARIPHATVEQRAAIAQRIQQMQQEIDNGKHLEGDRTP